MYIKNHIDRTTATDPRVIDLMRTAYDKVGSFVEKGRKLTEQKKLARKLMGEAAFKIGDLVDGYDVHGGLVRLCFPVVVKYGSTKKR